MRNYVLAGHSMGGWVTRMFAAAYPNEVAGLVVIDSSHPDQHRRVPGYYWQTFKYALIRRTKWYGARRLLSNVGLAALPDLSRAGRVRGGAGRAGVRPPAAVDLVVGTRVTGADRRRRAGSHRPSRATLP
ncbi:alpha/beta hydrolase [Nonomuraea sp. NPDC050404]|uniref:alpha/beta fold hydrolase n=1 Tax=Nonomuraea sp. NPDC050404 TaxID=3155783 RepID=UPI0033DEBCD0